MCLYDTQSYPVISSSKQTQMTHNALSPQLHSATQHTPKVLLDDCKMAVFADSSARMRWRNSGMWRHTSCWAGQVVTASAHKRVCVVRYTSTRNLIRHIFYDRTLTEIWMLPDVECAFDIVSNKWRVFHFSIDVRPDFCDVTVKTRCTVHNFVRQRDGFQFQDTLYECPLESVQAVGSRGNLTRMVMGGGLRGRECLSVGELAGG
jgi:hypothetical protein